MNFDPNGVVSFHDDGSPVQTNLSITFQETEFVTSKDEVDESFEQTTTNLANQAQAAERRERGLAALAAGRRVPVGQGFSSPIRDF